jgi:adenosylcobinamide-GDP ribazoletransferase
MKDSRLGTYGVVGLICMLGAKFYLLKELPGFMPKDLQAATNPLLNYRYFIGLILAAHSLSRWMSVSVIQQYEYVTSDDGSKSKPLASQRLSIAALIIATVFACLPLLLLPYQIAFAIIPMFLVRMEMANWFKKWIGGYTGDCLGAVQQVTEIIFYLSAIIIWRFI